MLRRWRGCRHKIKRDYIYIPAELIEQILLNLPLKSIFRFSTVSKLWNSIIFRPRFAGSYRGREVIVLKLFCSDFGFKSLACPLSLMSSDNPIDEATAFVFPFEFPGSYLASCDYLWCVEFENSLLLYNPSMQTYRKLPNPESEGEVPIGSTVCGEFNPVFVYGLGYDSVSDDYKILKIHKGMHIEAEIYSLTSDCWRKLESQPPEYCRFMSSKGLFVNGAFHWLVTRFPLFKKNGNRADKNFILIFHLSEEDFGLMELPELPKLYVKSQFLDLIVFGGKLRLYLNHECRFSVWVMEDYESKLWAKELEIDYRHIPPLCYSYLKPFYFYDSLGNLVKAVTCSNDMEHIFIYEYEEDEDDGSSTLVEKTFGTKGFGVIDTLNYVESFVSPF